MVENTCPRAAWLKVLEKIVRQVLWFPCLVLFVHAILALVLDAYAYLPPLDNVVHLAGGLAIAFSVWRGIMILCESALLQPLRAGLKAFLVFAFTFTAAVMWEFAEFVSDHTIGTNSQQGLNDTLLDMLYGIMGSLIFIAWKGLSASRAKRRQQTADVQGVCEWGTDI
jgi:hypothetical protein